MAGLDKIISQILDEASREASEITKKAQSQADEILKAAKDECQKAKEEYARQQEEQKKSYHERMVSSAELKKRQAILLAKQEVISKMLERAYEKLLTQNDNAYFEMIKKMLEKFTLAKTGEICFSTKDLERMPEGFEAEIQKIAKAKGGSLSLNKEGKELDGGFILIYGGIEENCSFKALMSAKKDELADKVHQLLFA